MSDFLPFALPSIGEAEIEEVCDTLRSGWLTTGPKTKQFEREFAQFVDARNALAVNSATAGLHLALEAIGIQPGDKVATTTYTFTASAEVIRYLGADPVFVDIDADTQNMNIESLERALDQNPDIAAIMPVHFAGQAVDMSSVLDLAKKHKARVVEDAAHALPTTYKDQLIGTLGDITVYSFYVTKTIATGEGGMVTTQNDEFAKRISTMRLHGISRDVFDRYTSSDASWYYEVVAPGYKYNMPDMAAAIGIHQLRRAYELRNRRKQIADLYSDAFSNLPLTLPVEKIATDMHAWHLYVVQLELDRTGVSRNEFINKMKDKGIGTSVHFIPLHMHPYWRDRYSLSNSQFPVASAVYEKVVSLPIYPSMTDADVERVVSAVKSILA